MDLVARKPICRGEPITMDYATFCGGPEMEAFECDCGAGADMCRGTIRGTDYLLAEVQEVYGDHVSSFIHRSRQEGLHIVSSSSSSSSDHISK